MENDNSLFSINFLTSRFLDQLSTLFFLTKTDSSNLLDMAMLFRTVSRRVNTVSRRDSSNLFGMATLFRTSVEILTALLRQSKIYTYAYLYLTPNIYHFVNAALEVSHSPLSHFSGLNLLRNLRLSSTTLFINQKTTLIFKLC